MFLSYSIVKSLCCYTHFLESFYLTAPFIQSLFFAFKVALITTVSTVLISCAVLFCLFHLRMKQRKKILTGAFFLFQIPIVIPYALSAILIFLLVLPHSFLGLTTPSLSNSTGAVILAYLYKLCPFMILSCYPQLFLIKDSIFTYYSLYPYSKLKVFSYLLLPRISKTLMVCSCIAFSYVFSAFDIPFILGSAKHKMPSILIMEKMSDIAFWNTNVAYIMGLYVFICTVFFSLCLYFAYILFHFKAK